METATYAMEILEFQETSSISLDDLKKDIDGFVAPQSYYYLDELPLLKYIKDRLEMKTVNIKHSFEKIESNQICIH